MKTKHYLLGLSFLLFTTFVYAQQSSEVNVDNHSFYQTDLVCKAAPHIGCGSKAKPILNELMANEGIKEAWLNRGGTVIAVVWENKLSQEVKTEIITKTFNNYQHSFLELKGEEFQNNIKSVSEGKDQWYLGDQVDQLTKEEIEFLKSGKSVSCNTTCSFNKENCNIDLKNCVKICPQKEAI